MRKKAFLIMIILVTSCNTLRENDISFVKYVVVRNNTTDSLIFYDLENRENDFSIKLPIDLPFWYRYPPIKIFDNQIFVMDINRTIIYKVNIESKKLEQIYSNENIRFRNFHINGNMLYLLRQNKENTDDNYILFCDMVNGRENILKIDSPANDLIVDQGENYVILDRDNEPEYTRRGKKIYTSTIYKLNLVNNTINIIDGRTYGSFSMYGSRLLYNNNGFSIIYDIFTERKDNLYIIRGDKIISDDIMLATVTFTSNGGDPDVVNRAHYFVNIDNGNRTLIFKSSLGFEIIGILR
jgi:hypothetical protein